MIRRYSWIDALRRYLFAVAGLNLIWEFAHMPLYQLWETGTTSEIVFAAVHCTGGDVLIALCAIVAALLLTGGREWPTNNNRRVLVTTILLGLVYTAFSEWLNIEVRGTWAYRDLMPVIPIINMGLSPALQWLVVPFASYWWAVHLTESISKKGF